MKPRRMQKALKEKVCRIIKRLSKEEPRVESREISWGPVQLAKRQHGARTREGSCFLLPRLTQDVAARPERLRTCESFLSVNRALLTFLNSPLLSCALAVLRALVRTLPEVGRNEIPRLPCTEFMCCGYRSCSREVHGIPLLHLAP